MAAEAPSDKARADKAPSEKAPSEKAPSDKARADLLRDLPPPGVTRWVVRRKAAVVAAVRGGAISLGEACRRYSLSVEEYRAWERSLAEHGVGGLKVTRNRAQPSAGSARQSPRGPKPS